ncbi:MAG: class I SAM-dependent methyltransferase [Deltaproteobacteria bacterium]
MTLRKDLHEANRASWNEATRSHNAHKREQAAFLRAGGSTLFPEELALLGEVRGLRVLHPQCNSGQDTLSLAARGALVTGVDISDEAIAFATRLAADSGLAAEWVRADVLEWLPEAAARGLSFERVFCSYGVAGWLSDLDLWARGIHGVLAPRGCFVYVEVHPLVWSFDEQFRAAKDPYFAPGHIFVEPVGDYVAKSGELLAPSGFIASTEVQVNPHPAHSFQWTLGDIVTAIASSGLVVERLEEYPFLNGVRSIASLVEREGRRLYPPQGVASIPLMFGLRARRAS